MPLILLSANFAQYQLDNYSNRGFSYLDESITKYDAKKIYAIDVGYGQLHERIKSNKKVISFEKTNAKYLDHKIIPEKIKSRFISAIDCS